MAVSEALKVSALAAVLTLAASLAAPSSAAQDHSEGFADVPADAYYASSVQSLAGDGVFEGTGCPEGFCPREAVDRRTIAVWLVRVLNGSDPAPITESRFDDVDADSFYAPFVERLADLGVTQGCGDGAGFCPGRTVTRSQMAAFLSRAFELADGADAGFFDVPADAWYRSDVARLVTAGVTLGCGDGTRFCGDAPTTRAQMATFIARVTGRITATRTDAPAVLLTYGVPRTTEGYWQLPSPDRNHVAYFAGSPGSTNVASLHVAGGDGTGLTRVSGLVAGDDTCSSGQLTARCGYDPVVWSPDSTRFLYLAIDPSTGTPSLHIADADGSSPTPIDDGERSIDKPSLRWSPDGERIAFSVYDLVAHDSGTYYPVDEALFVMDADGANRTYLGEDPSGFEWSPDGAKIAYTTWSSLWAVDVDGANRTHLGDGRPNIDDSSLRWSPDGERIAFSVYDHVAHDSDTFTLTDEALFAVDADGTNRTGLANLSDDPSGIEWPPDPSRIEWSPDGAKIAYTTADGALLVIGADGTNPMPIADGVRQDESGRSAFVWSPEGRRLAFLDVADPAAAGESVDVVVATVAYGERSVVATGAARGYECMLAALRWTADGIAVDLRPPTLDEPLPACYP